MAPKATKRSAAKLSIAPESTELRDLYDLKNGDEVRFRPYEGAGWKKCTVTGESGRSLSLFDGKMSRAAFPEKVEKLVIGPRGGKVWEPLVPQDA